MDEALRCKPEGVTGIFHFSFRPHYGPGVDSVSNRNEYQKYFLRGGGGGGKAGRYIGLTTLPRSCTDYLELQRISTCWSPQGLYSDCFTIFFYFCIKLYADVTQCVHIIAKRATVFLCLSVCPKVSTSLPLKRFS
jgi:hypothetical protein